MLVALRGSSQLLVVDANGGEVARAATRRAPVDIAVVAGEALVVSEGSGDVQRFAVSSDGVTATGAVASGGRSLRAIAARSPAEVVVTDVVSQTIEVIDLERGSAARSLGGCHDGIGLSIEASYLAANCSSDHRVRLWRGQLAVAKELGSIEHDGPIWSIDTHQRSDGSLLIAIGGVEDRPLDRSDQGSFGYIDSFVFLYELGASETTPRRVAAINVGAHGVITPKWVALEERAGSIELATAGYGSKVLLSLEWSADLAGEPRARTSAILPGTTSRVMVGGRALYADALFDGVIVDDKLEVIAATDTRSTESRIGELLFFTELMAPWSSSDERKSKFTCEACHFEGYVDGRTHFTGRDDVSATSRPLRGLFNNAPHFSRALDESTTEMVNNEFTVANKLNGRSPWFELAATDFPWLARGGVKAPAVMSPSYLRRALMSFLRDFTHGPNPLAEGRESFSAVEARGAALFRDRCEACHRAQLVASDERTRVDFADWERHIFSPSAGLVWGRSGYEKTGITPYVHERGARPPTLRRLYKKWPYFTNGSASSLDEVLAAARYGLPDDRFSHVVITGATEGTALSKDERAALLAFLLLL